MLLVVAATVDVPAIADVAKHLLMNPGAAEVGARSRTQVLQPGTPATKRCLQMREMGLWMRKVARLIGTAKNCCDDAQALETLREIFAEYRPTKAPDDSDLCELAGPALDEIKAGEHSNVVEPPSPLPTSLPSTSPPAPPPHIGDDLDTIIGDFLLEFSDDFLNDIAADSGAR